MTIINIALELTRKCNQQCAHCLRGDAQPKSMTLPVIKEVFEFSLKNSLQIGLLHLSGGEPTLAGKQMWWIREIAQMRKIYPFTLAMITNGLVTPNIFVKNFMWLAGCCQSLLIGVSRDKYHQNNDDAVLKWRSILEEYNIQGVVTWNYLYSVIPTGRAYYNVPIRDMDITSKPSDYDYEYNEKENEFEELDIYVNVYGDVLSTCDAEYNFQDDWKIGSIFDADIKEKIFEFFWAKKAKDDLIKKIADENLMKEMEEQNNETR